MMTNTFFGVAFALLAAHQVFETVRALVQKRVRRLTFRRTFAELEDEPTVFWFDTAYHGVAVFAFAIMSILMLNSEAR